MKIEYSVFERKVHRFGQISGWIALLMMVLFPLFISIWLGTFPDFKKLIVPLGSAILLMFVACISELIAYPPILGPGSLYMSNVSGNTSNLKIPCAITAIKIANIETGTPKANAVSMVAVGTSAITATALIIISLIFLEPLEPILSNPALTPAFNNVLPALFGGLAAMWILPNFKFSIVPFSLAFIMGIFLGISSTIRMPLTVLLSMGYVILLQKKETKGENKNETTD